MSTLTRHIEEDQLLQYADGELPGRKARDAQRHLEACWQCRAELKELQDLVNECVRYRKNVLQNYLPSPPVPWGDIYQGFARIDASRNDVSLFVRIGQAFTMRRAARWAPLAFAMGLSIIAFLELRQTPSVEASELLQRAVLTVESRPQKPHGLQIRTSRNQKWTRRTGADFQPLFLAANYSWDDPLSAKSFQAWRNQLVEKHDEVTASGDEYRIRTTTSSNEIREATLTLKASDMEPTLERLEFRNSEWVEIAPALAPDDQPIISHSPSTGQIPSHLPAPQVSSTVADELHVITALHGVGADLGDPIEVARNGNQILISGVGIAPSRQREIRAALESVPNAVVKFSEPEAAAVQPQPDGAPAASGTEPTPFQRRIEKQAGGRQRFEQLSAQILDSSETMMSRAYALRRLSERFSPAAESQLTPADRQILRNVSGEHIDALAQQENQIEKLLSPILTSAPASASSTIPPSASWQTATEEVFRSARQVDTLLAALLGAAAGESQNDKLPSQLLASLAQLRVNLDIYTHLSAQESGGK